MLWRPIFFWYGCPTGKSMLWRINSLLIWMPYGQKHVVADQFSIDMDALRAKACCGGSILYWYGCPTGKSMLWQINFLLIWMPYGQKHFVADQFSIDMDALRAKACCGGWFSIDMDALRAKAFCGGSIFYWYGCPTGNGMLWRPIFYWYECHTGKSMLWQINFLLIWIPYGQKHVVADQFSIDMDALRAIAEISHREIMSIERIRCMYCFVRRTLTTISERKYFNNAPNFLHPTLRTNDYCKIFFVFGVGYLLGCAV